MVKDAFALSPISARAVQPSEEDYEAISEAFMETARGRWFLGEYAKRNRNADTSMVLDAVARIEQSLASQKQQPTEDKLADALTAIKASLDAARSVASIAIEGLALEQNLAPVRKGARILKEISWRWREIGADGRICDLIDQQVAAIEASCEQLGSSNPRIALGTAFDLIARQLAQFDEHDEAPVAAAQRPVAKAASPSSASPGMADEVTQAAAKEPEGASSTAAPEASIETTTAIAPAEAISESSAPMAEVAQMSATEVAATEAVADAHDEAVLDIIAMEMAAIDPEDEEEQENQATEIAAQPADAPEMILPEPESSAVEKTPATPEQVAPPVETALAMPVEEAVPAMQETPSVMASTPVPPPLQPAMEATAEQPSATPVQSSPEALAQEILEASPEPSLGSAIVANGIIRKPVLASDPLASLRRLTQAEKIALFS